MKAGKTFMRRRIFHVCGHDVFREFPVELNEEELGELRKRLGKEPCEQCRKEETTEE